MVLCEVVDLVDHTDDDGYGIKCQFLLLVERKNEMLFCATEIWQWEITRDFNSMKSVLGKEMLPVQRTLQCH